MSTRRNPNLSYDQRQELAVQYAACRGPIRHRWDIIPSSPADRPSFGTLMLLRCDNCMTMRRDVFSRTSGDLLSRQYIYPDGYLDVEPLTTAERRALFAAIVSRREPDLLVDHEPVVTPLRRRRRA